MFCVNAQVCIVQVCSDSPAPLTPVQETERRRGAARALLDTALGREAGLAPAAREQLAARVEAQLFLACSSLIGGGYRRLVRRVVFGLGRQAVREEVVQGVRPVATLVREFMVEGRK